MHIRAGKGVRQAEQLRAVGFRALPHPGHVRHHHGAFPKPVLDRPSFAPSQETKHMIVTHMRIKLRYRDEKRTQ